LATTFDVSSVSCSWGQPHSQVHIVPSPKSWTILRSPRRESRKKISSAHEKPSRAH